MSFMSEEGRGDSVVLAKGRQVVTIVAAFFAVIALVLSVLVMMPTAHAVTVEDSEETSTTQESPDGDPAADEESQRATTTTTAESGQAPAGGESGSPGSPKNWANEYIESVDVYRFGSDTPLTGPPAKVTPMVEGTAMVFQVNWSALGKDEAAPKDVLHIDLPDWLKLSNTFDQPMANVGRCQGTSGSKQITCTFGERGPNVHVEKGYLKFTATAEKTKTAQAFKFGQVDVDAYYYFTGVKSGEVTGTVYNPENIGTTVTKGGQYSFEYDVAGKKYTQLVWNILIPKEKVNEIVDAGGVIEISDTLKPLTVTDPDTGKEVELPHYIAPMARGPFNVIRRSGESLERGTWSNNQEESKCQSGREFEQANIKCADKVYGNSGDTLKYFEGRQGEEVVFTGVTPEASWEKGNTFTARIENPVRDSAYRIGFFSVVPADSLKLLSSNSPKVQNTAQVNGERIETKNGVSVYVKGEVGASTYTDSTNFVIKKEVLPNFQDSDIKEFKVRYTIGDKTSECAVAPGSDCRVEKVAPDTPVTFEELAVEGSKLKWQPGVFSLVNGDTTKTKVAIDGNRATIANPVPGERVVLSLQNTYADKTGVLQIKKSVQGLDQPILRHNGVEVRDVEVEYACVAAGQPKPAAYNSRVKVPVNGDIVEIPNIPVGHECYVEENVSSAEVDSHHILVKYLPESRKVTIKEGQGENGSNLVTIVNTYTLKSSPLMVKKAIAGERPQGLNDDTEFTVKYQCDANSKDGTVKANQLAELKINAKGDVTEGPEFPHNSRCSVKEEKTDAPKFEDYGFTADLGNEVVIGDDAGANTITVTNTFKKDETKFRVTKAITGDAQDVAAAKTYEFDYTCGQDTGKLQITGAGSVESDKAFPVGTECTVKELGTEPDGGAQIENHILNVDPNVQQRFVVGKGENPTFTNNYTVKKAKFAIAKTVEGENGKGRNLPYTFKYVCNGETGTITVRGDGVPVESDREFPVGTQCEITEVVDPNRVIEGYEDRTPSESRVQTVVIGRDNVVQANFKNVYVREMGKFRVAKQVVKDAPELVTPAEFTVDYRCTKEGEEAKEGTLTVPADGVVDSEDIPTGYACVVTGEHDAPVPGATWANEIGSGVTIAKGNLPAITVTNTYSKDLGDFTLTKKVIDPDGVATDKTFEFAYVCKPPENRKNEKTIEGTLNVKAGGSATSPKIPAEFSCTITEVNAGIDDSNLATIGLDTALIINNDKTKPSVPVEVTNTYSAWKGTLEISKEISGSEAVKKAVGDHQFDVSYVCVKNGKTTNEGTLKVKAGEPAMVPGIVAKSECTVTENPDSAAVGELRFEPDASTTKVAASKIVADAGVGQAKLINAYVELGKFAVVKRVEGVRGGSGDKEFKFNYTCGADSGMLSVRGDGTPVEVDKVFPVGTECTITEDADSAAIADHADVTAGAERIKKVTVGAGAPAAVEFTNMYARDMGKFQVTKKVVTDAELKIPGEFKVDYRCTKEGEEAKEGTLTVPNNGSVESEEMPTGYACVVTREHDAQAPGATLVTEIGSGVKIAKGSVPAVQVTNTYTKNFGDFTITKTVIDPDHIADGKVFEFKYVCTPPESRKDEKPVEGTLKVKADEKATSPKIPAEFSCTITEVGAEIVDSNLVTTGLDSKLVIENEKNGKVDVENNYSQWKGSLKISKAIVGTPAVEKLVGDREFDVSLKCVKDGRTTNEDRVKVKAGETVTVNNIVANSACTVEENTDDVDVKQLRFLKDSSTTRVDAPKITANGGVTEAQIRNAYVELGHLVVTKEVTGLTGDAGNNDREFEIVASWTDNGKAQEKEFKIRAGEQFKDFPALPVGTKVVLKEKHPGNNALQQWNTPGFTSDRIGAVVDNRDGTAVVTIVSGTPADLPLTVKLTNTANPPWWWLALPGALLLGSGVGNANGTPGSANVGNSNPNGGDTGAQNTGANDAGANNPGAQNPGATGTTNNAGGGSNTSKSGATLARTGASVLGVLALAGVITALGIVLVRRNRNKS